MVTPTRYTGLATGMDTEKMIKDLMKPYNIRLDKMNQDKQILVWKQEMYRDMLTQMNGFRSKYFDVLNNKTYMLSSTGFSNNKVTNLVSSASVAASSTAVAGDYKIRVEQNADYAKSVGQVINKVPGSTARYEIKINENNNTFTVNGKEVVIPLEGKEFVRYSNPVALAGAINKAMSSIATTGENKLSDEVKAVVKNDTIEFQTAVKLIADKKTPEAVNNVFNFKYSGKDYSVELAQGVYTAEELVSAINAKLPGLTSTDDTKTPIPKDTKLTYDANSQIFKFEDTDAELTNAKIGDLSFTPGTIAASVKGGTDSTTLSVPSVTGNTLSYDKKIITGFNDTMDIKVSYNEGGTSIFKRYRILLPNNTDVSNMDAALTNALKAAKEIDDNGNVILNDQDLTSSIGISKSSDGRIILQGFDNKQITMLGSANAAFGLPSSFSISMPTNALASDIFSTAVNFTINGVQFSYDFTKDYDKDTAPEGAKNKTINQVLQEINSKAGVEASYNSSTKSFSIQSRNLGAEESINIKSGDEASKTFLNNVFGLGIGATNETTIRGKDARITVTDPSGNLNAYHSSNNGFNVNGLNVNISGVKENTDITFSVTKSADEVFDKIKGLIEDYNKFIDVVNQKTSEKRLYNYAPLTADQKKDMKDSEIAQWDEKSKQGLLRSDRDLLNMVSSMRRAFFDSVEGTGLSLSEIGLSTSKDISQGGKIIIDELKLKSALESKGDRIAELFTKKSASYPNYNPNDGIDAQKKRYAEEGIFQRINDIIMDYGRVTNGKGTLANKAGVKGDFTEYKNLLTDQIKSREKLIEDMKIKIVEKENRYYLQFAQLEKAMQQANSQSSWLSQQLGMGQK